MVTVTSSRPGPRKGICAIIFLMLLADISLVTGQEPVYNFFYRVGFKDKGEYNINDFYPSGLLSPRAVSRRQKAGIPLVAFTDIPVFPDYIDQISALGFKLHCTSKWMNTALFKTENLADINVLRNLPFVGSVNIVRDKGSKTAYTDKLAFTTFVADIPAYDRPVSMLNGLAVHNSGFNGNGIVIAILDGGFINADNITSLGPLRNRGGIKGTYDFVEKKKSVYDYHNHGTAVLSVLAGLIPEALEGTATGADYWLLRTEDTNSEFPVEEDYWTAGAEYADSIGADIITSSLGYYVFDDPFLNHKYSDMDGNTTFVTKAADIAASKGILVVNSAGNERNTSWIHLIAPSDGDSIVAVGAVDGTGIISTFSSAGPSFDRRVKPDVVAQGVSVPVQIQAAAVIRSNGTSFSCPVISGMCACVMQAVPQATNTEIITALHSSSDKYQYPDSLYGYGIPDFVSVIRRLQEKYIIVPENESVVNPNPFSDELKITFRDPPGSLKIEVFTSSGRIVLRKYFKDYISRSIKLNDIRINEDGIYFVRLSTNTGTVTHKVIRISH